jgi:hypothetical protein
VGHNLCAVREGSQRQQSVVFNQVTIYLTSRNVTGVCPQRYKSVYFSVKVACCVEPETPSIIERAFLIAQDFSEE